MLKLKSLSQSRHFQALAFPVLAAFALIFFPMACSKRPPAKSSAATLNYPCSLGPVEGRRQAPDIFDDVCVSREATDYPCTADGKKNAPDLYADVCTAQPTTRRVAANRNTVGAKNAAAFPCNLGPVAGRKAAPDIYDDACVGVKSKKAKKK